MRSGDVIAGKYRLSSLLARGGMGAVWRARHLVLDVDIAVKLMAPSLVSSPEQRARFAREAKAAAQIKSPHVVQIHDCGLDGDTPYIVMELLDGEDLGARLRREKRLSPGATAALLAQIGRGLRRAHEMGIVHRDLKPANIFLAHADEEETAKILDFGIARAASPDPMNEATLTGELIGSPPYMSPEQARGLKSIDHRADQWSLGVVLYRMLTGKLPFQSNQPGDLIVKICTESVPPPSSIVPSLTPAIDGFFAQVFERDPEHRFASVRELVSTFVEAATPGASPRPSSPTAVPLPPAMPHVPVGRTTVRMDPGFSVAPAMAPAEISVSPTSTTLPLPRDSRASLPDDALQPPRRDGSIPDWLQAAAPRATPDLPLTAVPAATLAGEMPSLTSASTTTSGATTQPIASTPGRTKSRWVAVAAAATLAGGIAAALSGLGRTNDGIEGVAATAPQSASPSPSSLARPGALNEDEPSMAPAAPLPGAPASAPASTSSTTIAMTATAGATAALTGKLPPSVATAQAKVPAPGSTTSEPAKAGPAPVKEKRVRWD